MGKEAWRAVLRIQGQRGNLQQDQAHTELHGVYSQSPRLQGDGARTDRAAQGSLWGTGVARRGICRDGGCGEGETHDSDNLRERHERPSVDGGAEGAQPPEVEGAEPRGACLRIHGADNGRFGVLGSGNWQIKGFCLFG